MIRRLVSYLLVHSGTYKFIRINKSDVITILCFHRITDHRDKIWFPVGINNFRKIIEHCRKNYEIILPEQWNITTSRPKLMITFDDGFGEFMEYALPILSAAKIKALHNVVIDSVLQNRPNWTYRLNQLIAHHLQYKQVLSFRSYDIDFEKRITETNASHVSVELMLLFKAQPFQNIETILQDYENSGRSIMQFPRMMNKEDLLQCESGGVQIGSHGYSHILLHESLGEAVLHKELVESKQVLEKLLLHRVSSFAFPAGFYDEKVKQVATAAGYDFLFATGDQFFSAAGNTGTPVIFPRIVPPTSGTNEVILKLEGFHYQLKNRLKSA